ncbi:MAG TPA: nitric oxide dioxygenase, partial [Sporosarcina sp.]|nr:nitric oxide dioxygenase [Sporosarcina sp.]
VVRNMTESLTNATYGVLYSEEGDGFINREFLAKHVAEGSDVYVCGPTPFMQAVISALHQIGFPEEKIHFEFFGPKEQLELVNA